MGKYKVKLSISAEKFISRLDGSIKTRVFNELEKLEVNPIPKDKRHILEVSGSSSLCELAVDKFRFYYTIENQFVVIEKVEYEGLVEVLVGHSNHKSGGQNWSNQRKDIIRLKKWFLNLFKKK